MKTKELRWEPNQGIQTTGIEDSQGNIIVYQSKSTEHLGEYITEICNQANRPENLEVETEEEVDEDEKGFYILYSKLEKAIKNMRDKAATVGDDVPGDELKCWEKMVSE